MTASALAPTCGASSLEEAERVLRDRGLRRSAARRLVLTALFTADGPVTADAIAGGLQGRLPRSDLASVYRNLETLESVGLVRHVHLGHAPGLYALAQAGHEYVMCEACGAVRTLPSSALDGVRDAVREAVGHEARFSHFPLVGLCRTCAEASLPHPSEDHVRA